MCNKEGLGGRKCKSQCEKHKAVRQGSTAEQEKVEYNGPFPVCVVVAQIRDDHVLLLQRVSCNFDHNRTSRIAIKAKIEIIVNKPGGYL